MEGQKLFPSVRYHRTEKPVTVKNPDEESALGECWVKSPADFEEKVALEPAPPAPIAPISAAEYHELNHEPEPAPASDPRDHVDHYEE